MKCNIVLTIISAALAGLAAFGFFMANNESSYHIVITIGSGLSLFITLGGLLAITASRNSIVNIRAISVLFLVLFLVEHIIFSFIGVVFPPYVVITGILVLLYVLACYLIIRAGK